MCPFLDCDCASSCLKPCHPAIHPCGPLFSSRSPRSAVLGSGAVWLGLSLAVHCAQGVNQEMPGVTWLIRPGGGEGFGLSLGD